MRPDKRVRDLADLIGWPSASDLKSLLYDDELLLLKEEDDDTDQQ